MVVVNIIDESKKDYWDEGISTFDHAHPLNSYYWGKVRSIDKWRPLYLAAERNGKFCGGMMVLIKKFPILPISIFYSPKGPVTDYSDEETILSLIEKVKEIAKKENSIFIRIDPNIPEGLFDEKNDIFVKNGFLHLQQRWTFWNSPRDVYRIALIKYKDSEELFNKFDRDTRRCVRKAAKDGLEIEVAKSDSDLVSFYKIFKDFSVKKGFMSRDFEYQKELWETFIKNSKGRLFLAKYQGEIIGGLICIMFAKKCLAMHMGTPYKYHKLQTNYAYVWESVKWAKEEGCMWYSFRGVGTTPSQEYFKSKFLPEVVRLVGYYDLPFNSLFYKVFNFSEFVLLPNMWSNIIRTRELFYNLKKRLKSKSEKTS